MTDAKIGKEDVDNAKKLISHISHLDKQCWTSDDCGALPVGAKPCGGPSDYIVYSKLSSYADDIEKLATLSSKLESEYHQENPDKRPCTVVGAPTVTCSFNICQRSSFLYAIVYPLRRS